MFFLHHRLFLHTTLHGFKNKLFKRQGWQGLPGTVPPLSPQDEKALITPLLEGLSTMFKMNLDTLPNLSRDTAIFPTSNTPVEDDMAALFIGGAPRPLWASLLRLLPPPAGSFQQMQSQPSFHK
jgi:hypothetical protein